MLGLFPVSTNAKGRVRRKGIETCPGDGLKHPWEGILGAAWDGETGGPSTICGQTHGRPSHVNAPHLRANLMSLHKRAMDVMQPVAVTQGCWIRPAIEGWAPRLQPGELWGLLGPNELRKTIIGFMPGLLWITSGDLGVRSHTPVEHFPFGVDGFENLPT